MIKEGFRIRACITAVFSHGIHFQQHGAGNSDRDRKKDAATNAPLSNASVSHQRQRGGARTNAEGRFRIPADKTPLDLVRFQRRI